MRFLIIANPKAGNFAGLAAARAAARLIEEAGHAARILATKEPRDATRIAREESAGMDAVVAVGGDGTLVEVVAGLTDRPEMVVGLIPMGTANVVAREFGLPRGRPRRAAALLLASESRPLDWGFAGDRPFIANVGVGYDAEVIHGVAAKRQATGRRIGMAGFVPIGFNVLRAFETPRLFFQADDGPREGPFSTITVTNTANYGGIMSLCPEALPDDGLLDLFAGRARGRTGIVRHLADAFLRCQDARVCVRRRGRSFRIESEGGPREMQIDGDPGGPLPVLVRIADRPLRFLGSTRRVDGGGRG